MHQCLNWKITSKIVGNDFFYTHVMWPIPPKISSRKSQIPPGESKFQAKFVCVGGVFAEPIWSWKVKNGAMHQCLNWKNTSKIVGSDNLDTHVMCSIRPKIRQRKYTFRPGKSKFQAKFAPCGRGFRGAHMVMKSRKWLNAPMFELKERIKISRER